LPLILHGGGGSLRRYDTHTREHAPNIFEAHGRGGHTNHNAYYRFDGGAEDAMKAPAA